VSALAPLAKIVDQAQRAPAYHWLDTQIVGLIRYAVEALRQGLWDFAFDNAEKALKKETARNNGRDFALKFSEELIKLRDRVTHDDRGAAQVVSLREEIKEKKERKDGRQELLREITEEPGSHHTAPCSAMAKSTQPIRQAEPNQEALALVEPRDSRARAANESLVERPSEDPQLRSQLRSAYWDAILSRDPTRIWLIAGACRDAGLSDLLETTKKQLTEDLHPLLREARRVACEVWEERSE
jgi:hypothetical protein